MSSPGERPPTERGDDEARIRTLLTTDKEEPPKLAADEEPGEILDEFDAAFIRSKELNPDDFE
ncbi:hypothetical protein ETD86_17005 [Nonomuraea turkmeniaca]|uniref:Uncharacterized protein n=1 Tax=Nonomuraea turkmeniaca TaxID=103838 RepID=A0A5S4FJW8_9ACTN|nr:hypothetical protein [Nonomuraea turkmeniaca]TMR20952.1 hypothetical protein ETD86_17005 [Nonomuraea turkmeniaca]